MNDLTHIDLFSGIGGFALAAGWAGFRTIAMCEIEPFCQEVLKARFGAVADAEDERLQGVRSEGEQEPEAYAGQGLSVCGDHRPILIPDIRDFDGTQFRGATLLTGGFPCQPFSCAGKRRGQADDRHLWPEMLRVIQEARPAWVVGENVAGIINMELEQVCLDLEGEGYEVQPIIIPACAVGAPHRRDRVWIIGHDSNAERGGRWSRGECGGVEAIRRGGPNNAMPPTEPDSDAPDAASRETQPSEPGGFHAELGGENKYAPDSEITELDRGRRSRPGREGSANRDSWDIPWIEVATRFCRVDDGLPAWIHSRRVARLKALGNAIVPQVAYQIVKAMGEIERAT